MTLDIIGQILIGVLLPALVCGIIFLLRMAFGNWISAIAITIGFLLGYFVYVFVRMEPSGGLWPELSWNFKAYNFPPSSLKDWLPHVAVLALLLGLLENFWRKNLWVLWGLRLVLVEVLLWRLLKSFFKVNPFFPERSWGADDAIINFGVTTLIIVVFWLLLDVLTKRYEQVKIGREQAILPSALVIITSGSAFSIVLGHSLVGGQINGSLTAALGAVMVLSWLFKGWCLSPVTTPIIALLQGMFWINGYYFADLPLVSVILLSLVPVVLLIPLAKLELWQRAALQIVLVSLPVAAAVLYTWKMT